MTLLDVRDLQTYFRTRDGLVRAVDGVSFQVGDGETIGLVGESGCGKSVSALSLMKLVPDAESAGEIWFGGQPIHSLSSAKMREVRGRRMAMIFQDPMTSLNPVLTVGRQISEALIRHLGMDKRGAWGRSVELLEMVGIPGAKSRVGDYPHQFSGGMRQRVMIAMAVSCDPKLILADEITTALDVTIQAQILDLMKQLVRELQTSLVMITHDLGVIAGMSQRVYVMYAGKIVEAADTRDLFGDPRMPYTWGLLRSMPRLDKSRTRRLVPIEGLPPDLASPLRGCRFEPRCQYRRPICREEEPALVAIEGSERPHLTRCWGTQRVPNGGWLADSNWEEDLGDPRVIAEIRRDASAADPPEVT